MAEHPYPPATGQGSWTEDGARLLRHFVGDRPAIVVAAGKMWGMTGPQICTRFGLEPAEVEAAAHRIRRYAKRLRGDKGG